MATKRGKRAGLPLRDDLPVTPNISALRASGAVAFGALSVLAIFEPGGFAREVKLTHRVFPKGGNWSFYLCPCGRRARRLRLFDGRIVCRYCDGLMARIQAECARPAAHAARIARLRAQLAAGPAKRQRLEWALRRALLRNRRRRLGKVLDELGRR
jgi:hypothetical protein